MKCTKFVTYAKKYLVLIKTIKMYLNYIIKKEIIVITPKESPIVFHNGSTYDYHFVINQLAKEFDGQLECLGENREKYIIFSVPIKKEIDNDKTLRTTKIY